MKFLIHEKYIIRQKMIDHLYSKVAYNDKDVPFLGNTKTKLTDIAAAIGTDYRKIYDYHHAIPQDQAICKHFDDSHGMMLMPEGINASIEKYWLNKGYKELNETIYDFTKWIVPVLAFAISIFTAIYSTVQISNMKDRISTIETRPK